MSNIHPQARPHRVESFTGWSLRHRERSGLYAVSHNDTLLFRFDPTAQVLHCWDKRVGCEIPIPLSELLRLTQPQPPNVV